MRAVPVLAALGALLGFVSAHERHDHQQLHRLKKKCNDVSPAALSSDATCGCITTVTTWFGPATLVQPTTTLHQTMTHTSTSYSTVTLYATSDSPAPYTTFSSTGIYTVPATTITVTSTVVVPCPTASSSDTYPPGTYTRSEMTLTITETNSVYVCPYTSAAPAPTSEAPVSAPPAPTSEAPPAPSSEYSAPAASASPSTTDSGSAPISGNGQQWAMTYSPYTAAGGCKDAATVFADITAIQGAGFTTVRLYSTDCSGLENVGNACHQHNLKLVLGIFIDAKGIDAARPQVTDIISWGQWHMVELIVIGNEALFNKHCDVGSLAGFIAESSAQFHSAGYTGPCTTTETLNIWQEQGAALCAVIDVMGANIHPFFNSQVSPDQAGAFTAGQIQLLTAICPGKEVYNLESGWPHSGDANGLATPGYDHQRTALQSILDTVGTKTIFFSFEDDLWKQPGAFAVEQSWGCNSVFASA